MEITFHGHSTVQITTNDTSLIIDPFLTGNPLAKVKADDIRVNYVLLTHGHSDHTGDALQIAKQNDATVVATFELASYFGWQGAKIHPMNTGGGWNFDFGRVKLTQAFHSSGLTNDTDGSIVYLGMPCGILLNIEGKTIYHAGDTALFGDMKLIGELNSVDLAFLPIGDNFTMGPDEALLAAQWIKAKKVVPIHYDTFGLIKQDAGAFVDNLKGKGIEGLLVQPGETFSL